MSTTDHNDEVITLPTRYVLHGEFADYIAMIAKCGDMYYPLTMCCRASATGSMGETCCRDCYGIVDTVFGCCWTETEWQEKHAQQ